MEGYKAKTVVIEHHCGEIEKHEKFLSVNASVEFHDTEWILCLYSVYTDIETKIPIVYCPFCGRDLRQDA